MIILPKKHPNISQQLIRNFIPIPNYDDSFGINGMYCSLEWLIDGDKYVHPTNLYIVIDPMNIAIGLEVIKKYLLDRSNGIILAGSHLIISFDLSKYLTDVTKILSGKFSKTSEEGKKKMLEGIPESRESDGGRIRDSRWTIFYPTKNELERLCSKLGIAKGSVTEILSKPEIEDETFQIKIKKEIYELLW